MLCVARALQTRLSLSVRRTVDCTEMRREDARRGIMVDDGGRGFDFDGHLNHDELERLRKGARVIRPRVRLLGGMVTLSSFNITLLPFGDKLVRLPIPPAWRFKRARARLDATVYRLIAERRASGVTGSDVLSMMVAARDEEGDRTGMTDEQIRDEAMTLLLAGHETTANALTWSWYLLSLHESAERRLHAEVDAVLRGRVPSAADVAHLTYARAVIAESMRLFPPAYILGRRALEPYRIPGTDYELPRGTVVLVSQYLLHRDPRFWDRPEAFEPERWLDPDTRPERQRYA